METPQERDRIRCNLQRQVITWLLLAGATFLLANAWLIVHMFEPIS
jgi:hypothetical protein